MDAANCSSRPCPPDVYTVHVHTRTCYPNVPIDQHVTPSTLTVLSANSDEEASDGLDGQDASRPLSVDGEAVPGGEQAPIQGRPPRSSAPDLSAVREGGPLRPSSSTRRPGDWCALRARPTVSWSALVDRVELSGHVVAMYERVLCETVNW